jgi:hypothetical protein
LPGGSILQRLLQVSVVPVKMGVNFRQYCAVAVSQMRRATSDHKHHLPEELAEMERSPRASRRRQMKAPDEDLALFNPWAHFTTCDTLRHQLAVEDEMTTQYMLDKWRARDDHPTLRCVKREERQQ